MTRRAAHLRHSRTGKVIALHTIDGGPSPDVQRIMARAITHMRDPATRAVAFVVVRSDDTVATAYAGQEDGHRFALTTGITRLAHRIHAED